MSRLLMIQIDPGLPPPAPVSSQILMGATTVGTHHVSGRQRMELTSGGASEAIQA